MSEGQIFYSRNALLLFTSALSVSGVSFVLYRFVRTAQKSYAFWLIALLSISDWLWNACIFVMVIVSLAAGAQWSVKQSSPLCQGQSLLKGTAMLMSFFWSACIAHMIRRGIVANEGEGAQVRSDNDARNEDFIRQPRSPLRTLWPFGVALPVLLASVPLFTHTYAPAEPMPTWYCWISAPSDDAVNLKVPLVEFLCLEFVPWVVLCAYVATTCWQSWKKVAQYNDLVQRSNQRRQMIILALYPAALFFCWLPINTMRLVQYVDQLEHENANARPFTTAQYATRRQSLARAHEGGSNTGSFLCLLLLTLFGFLNSLTFGCFTLKRTNGDSEDTASRDQYNQTQYDGTTIVSGTGWQHRQNVPAHASPMHQISLQSSSAFGRAPGSDNLIDGEASFADVRADAHNRQAFTSSGISADSQYFFLHDKREVNQKSILPPEVQDGNTANVSYSDLDEYARIENDRRVTHEQTNTERPTIEQLKNDFNRKSASQSNRFMSNWSDQ